MTQNRYFGTDGIRGTFGEEPMTPSLSTGLDWLLVRL